MILLKSDGAVIAGLKQKFNEAARRSDVKAIVLTGEFSSLIEMFFFFLIKVKSI